MKNVAGNNFKVLFLIFKDVFKLFDELGPHSLDGSFSPRTAYSQRGQRVKVTENLLMGCEDEIQRADEQQVPEKGL